MGLFNKLKKEKFEKGLTKENKEEALNVLKSILHALHNKKFESVLSCVHESEIEDLENYLIEYIQGTLELNDFDVIDEYGVECKFKPEYEYSQLYIDEYNDKSGFFLDYDLTSNGYLVDLTLKLKFLYTDTGLKNILVNIDPQ